MQKRYIGRFDMMDTKTALRLARFGITDKKTMMNQVSIMKTFKNLKYIRKNDPDKKMGMRVHFKGGYIYLDKGEIGFHLDNINNESFKFICKTADKMRIKLENFDINAEDEYILFDGHKMIQQAIDIIISEL